MFCHFEDCGSYVANAATIPPETLPFQLQSCLYAFYPVCSSSHSTNLNMCFKMYTSCASAVHLLSGSQHASNKAQHVKISFLVRSEHALWPMSNEGRTSGDPPNSSCLYFREHIKTDRAGRKDGHLLVVTAVRRMII